MGNEAAQKRLDDLQNVVTELHDNLPVVMNSRLQNQIADPHLERIAEALVLITEELRELSVEVRGNRSAGGGAYVAPRAVPRDPGDPNPATMGF